MKKLCSFVCFIICSLLLFVACEPVDKVIGFFADDGTGHIFKIALPDDPDCLDPQLAEGKCSVAVAKNLYSGLMEYDENGRLKCCMASDYTVSSDGLEYVFTLKEGFKWHALGNYEFPVTAADFVFGFRRLMDPGTASTHSEKYFCIKNASKVRSGELSTDQLGVEAPDEYTVKFTLEYQNAEFLQLLADLPASPCCEDFFIAAGGKYGLEAEAICSNGPFFVRYWLHDPYGKSNYVRLRRNPGYSDVEFVNAGGINFLITKDPEERISDFESGATDVLLTDPYELPALDGEEYISGYGDVCGLIFNENEKIFKDSEVRQLFSWAIGRDAINSDVPELLKPAGGMIPSSGNMYLRGYASRLPEEVCVTNMQMAEYKWSFLLTDREKSALVGMTVMVPDDFGAQDYLTAISDSWYDVFGSHVSIEKVNRTDYQNRLKSGDYDIALITLSSDDDGALGYLEPFGSQNLYGISVDEVKNCENLSGHAESLSSLNYACSEAENAVLAGYHFLPLWQLPTVCAYDDDCEGFRLDPFSKTVYFKEAKCY